MRKLIASLALALTLVAGSYPLWPIPKSSVDARLEQSLNLYVPITCTSPQYFRWPIGTGFKIGPHTIMTAGHVNCVDALGPGTKTEISDDAGLHWVLVYDDHNVASQDVDVRIYDMPQIWLKPVGHFREPVLGESVTVFGQAGGIPSGFSGIVARADSATVGTTIPGIGGLSGSAIVADDGAIVGITDLSRPFYVGEHFVTALSEGPSGPVLQRELKLLEQLLIH